MYHCRILSFPLRLCLPKSAALKGKIIPSVQTWFLELRTPGQDTHCSGSSSLVMNFLSSSFPTPQDDSQRWWGT